MQDSNLSLWQKDSFKWKTTCQETKSLSEFSQLLETVLQGSNASQITAYNLMVEDTQDTFDTFIIVFTVMIVLKIFSILGSGAIFRGKHGPCGFALLWIATDVT